MIQLGSVVRDRITGFQGTATGRATWLAGCVRINVEYLKDDEIKSEWVDEPRLEAVGERPPTGEVIEAKVAAPVTGGDRVDATRPAPIR